MLQVTEYVLKTQGVNKSVKLVFVTVGWGLVKLVKNIFKRQGGESTKVLLNSA